MLVARLGAILMLITAIAATALALINKQTAPIIAENKAQEAREARQEVTASLGDVTFEEVVTEDGFTYYLVKDLQGAVVGFVGTAFGKGYSSTIETVTGMNRDFEIVGMRILFQQETPGLGTKAEEPSFLDQFNELKAGTVAVKKDGGSIDSITGATITSRAISVSVQELANQIQADIEARGGVDQTVETTTVDADSGSHTEIEVARSPGAQPTGYEHDDGEGRE